LVVCSITYLLIERLHRDPIARALEPIVEDYDAGCGESPGIPPALGVVASDGSAPDVRSDFEALVLPRLVAMGVPWPSTNVKLHAGGEWLTVDFFWQSELLVVETDGGESHETPIAFQRDRKRDQLLLAAGYRVARVTWDQMRDEREGVIARIIAALGAGA